MKGLQGPTLGGPGGNIRAAANIMPPLVGAHSGELVATVHKGNLGPARFGGRVSAVWMSVGKTGNTDDQSALLISGEIYINDVSCLTTQPSINHISGEANQQKTTKITGDTGIIQAAIDPDASSFSPGDVLTYDIICDRGGTPTEEIHSPCIVAELEPSKL